MELGHAEKKEGRAPPSGSSTDEKPGGGGGRQLYDCTYCRRGFPTAQALGGHMNIHRKDRAKASPPPAAAYPLRVHEHETLVAFSGRPQSAATAAPAAGRPQELSLFGHGVLAGEGDGVRDRGKDRTEEGGSEELDLELRLGGS